LWCDYTYTGQHTWQLQHGSCAAIWQGFNHDLAQVAAGIVLLSIHQIVQAAVVLVAGGHPALGNVWRYLGV
jgi:hypothetical protein